MARIPSISSSPCAPCWRSATCDPCRAARRPQSAGDERGALPPAPPLRRRPAGPRRRPLRTHRPRPGAPRPGVHRRRPPGAALRRPGGLRPGQGEPGVQAPGVRLRGRRLRRRTRPGRASGGPGIRLRFVQTPTIVVDATDALLGTTDGLLMPHGVISDFPATDLYDDRWVFLAAEEHARVGDRLTREDLARLPRVTHQRTYDAPAVRQLGMLASSRAWRAPSTAPRVLHPGAGPAAPLPAPATALDARHHRAAPVVAAPHAAAFTGLLDARGRVRPPRPGPPGARGGPRHPGTARADRLAAPAPGPGWRCVRLPPDDRRRGRPALRLRGGGRTRARPMSRPRRRARPGWPPGPGCRRPGRRWSPARRSRRRWARRA